MTAGASAALGVVVLLAAPAPAAEVVFTLADPVIIESSGLAVSGRHPGITWTHNDGGSTAQVIGVDRDGATVARVTLAGIDPYDPEALAPGVDDLGEPALYLADIGDNEATRPDVSVFRFAEPERLDDVTVPATWFRFTYPDGAHDAEAVLVDRSGRIALVTKEISGAAVYLAPRDLVTEDQGGINRLTRLRAAPSLVTDGAGLPDGGYVLRTYTSVYRYGRQGREVASAALPLQPQGESLAVDGDRLLVGTEGGQSQVLRVDLPSPARSPQVDQDQQLQAQDERTREYGDRDASRVARVGVIVLMMAGLVVVLRRSRRRGRERERSWP